MTLRVLLICAFLVMLAAQIFGPFVIAEIGFTYPRVEPYVTLYSILLIFVLALAQAALFTTWKLLNIYSEGQAFNAHTVRTFNVAIILVGIDVLIAIVALIHLLFVAQEGGPLVPISLLATLIFGSTLILGLLVARRLLLKSVQNQDELDGTI